MHEKSSDWFFWWWWKKSWHFCSLYCYWRRCGRDAESFLDNHIENFLIKLKQDWAPLSSILHIKYNIKCCLILSSNMIEIWCCIIFCCRLWTCRKLFLFTFSLSLFFYKLTVNFYEYTTRQIKIYCYGNVADSFSLLHREGDSAMSITITNEKKFFCLIIFYLFPSSFFHSLRTQKNMLS
jgi:hypothetical protein